MHHDHSNSSTPSPHQGTLSEAELQRLHRQDVLAARVVAGLMTVIFLIGLVLYSAIAYLAVP